MQEPPPPSPATEETLTIAPSPAARMCGAAARLQLKRPRRFAPRDVVPDFVGDGIEVVVGDEVGHGAVVDEDVEGAELVDGGLDEALAVGVFA